MAGNEKWWQTELAKDVHSNLRKREIELPVYRSNSPQICYRKFLVNWLALIGEKMGLLQEVVHLAVRYLDHVMDRYELLMESQLNMLAICCLSLAAKIGECEDNIPKVSNLRKFCKESFAIYEFVAMEVKIAACLNWKLILPTAANFVDFYTMESLSPSDLHAENEITCIVKARSYLQRYAQYFIEVSLQDYMFMQFLPSLVASAAVYSARICLQLTPVWPLNMISLTKYSIDNLQKCKDMMMRTHDIDAKRTKKNNRTAEYSTEVDKSSRFDSYGLC